MITKLLGILKGANCNRENVSNYCERYLSDYDYSYGGDKIVVRKGKVVFKAIFGNPPQDEVAISKAAVEAGLGKFFALATMQTDNVYVQESIDISLNEYIVNLQRKVPYGSLREDYVRLGLQEMLYRSDCVVLYYLFLSYPLEEILKLQDFIVEHNLSDLNFYNAGLIDGKVKFFDFSGTEEW